MVPPACGRPPRNAWRGQVDQPGPAVQVRVIEHLLRRDFHAARIGDIAVQVGERQLHGLDLQMLRLHRIDRHVGQVEALADAQRDQRGDALPVGRDLVQLVAAVGAGNRLDPLGAVIAQIVQRHGAAAFLAERGDALGQLALVEVASARGGDASQRVRGVGEEEMLAHPRRAPLGHERLA